MQLVTAAISGTDITVYAGNGGGGPNSTLTLGSPGSGATNIFTGDLILAGPANATVGLHQVTINNPQALPSTATVRMQRIIRSSFSGREAFPAVRSTPRRSTTTSFSTITGAVFWGDYWRLRRGRGYHAAANCGYARRRDFGASTLTFQLGNGGGNGSIILANHSTYTGSTNLNSNNGEVLRLGINARSRPVRPIPSPRAGSIWLVSISKLVGFRDLAETASSRTRPAQPPR